MRGHSAESLCGASETCFSNSYDIVGDIAILRLKTDARDYAREAVGAVMTAHSNIKTVLAQTGPVQGGFRLRRLAYVAGEDKRVTVHRESGCLFAVNLEESYFSPRLSYERRRIAGLVGKGEVIVNMFAGVGCFSAVIAKHSDAEKIYSIDINPNAIQNMKENVRLNRSYGRAIPNLGDAREIIEKSLRHMADRVLMPLPEKALEYLPSALLALKGSGGWIHYYAFEHARRNENPIMKAKLKITERIASLNSRFGIPFGRVVRTTRPNWYQIVLDIRVNLGK